MRRNQTADQCARVDASAPRLAPAPTTVGALARVAARARDGGREGHDEKREEEQAGPFAGVSDQTGADEPTGPEEEKETGKERGKET